VTAGLDPDYVQELFAVFGPVAVRRMFGGAGIFAGGTMIGLISDDIIYLKTDGEGAAAFVREGCTQFAYMTRAGERMVMSYWRMPDRLYDDPDELAVWARASLSVAQANQAVKAKPRPKRSAPARTRRR